MSNVIDNRQYVNEIFQECQNKSIAIEKTIIHIKKIKKLKRKIFFIGNSASNTIGSHLQSGIPLYIRNMGYSRIDDNIINKFFDSSELIEFSGKKELYL